MKYQCPKCGKRYDTTGMPPLLEPPKCSNGKRHTQVQMKPLTN